MGTDPQKSVVDPLGRANDCPNLVILSQYWLDLQNDPSGSLPDYHEYFHKM